MERVYLKRIGEHVGNEVEIRGWLYNKRSSGRIQFLIIRDGTDLIQGVLVKAEVSEAVFEAAKTLTQESSVIVRGVVREEPRSLSGYELSVTDLKILQIAEEYPITPKEHGVEYLMDRRHLWLRSQKQHAVMLIRNEVIKASRQFFDERDFVLIDAPILTPASVEGTSLSLKQIISRIRRIYPRAGSSIWKRRPWPLARSTVLAPPFEQKSPRPAAI
jgi:asparaginyl-tRNA synthetase